MRKANPNRQTQCGSLRPRFIVAYSAPTRSVENEQEPAAVISANMRRKENDESLASRQLIKQEQAPLDKSIIDTELRNS